MEMLLIFLLIILPIPFSLYVVWRDYLINRNITETLIMSVVSFVPIISVIGMLVAIFDKGTEKDDDFVGFKFRANGVLTCSKCNITSRYYQIKDRNIEKCPQCNWHTLSRVVYEKDSVYPFAPKLSEFQAIKYLLHKNKMDKLKSKLSITERYDKELEAYGKLQMKKLHELEVKANEIRAELAKTGVNQQ